MKFKDLMKDYQWQDKSAKTKYQICDWGTVALIIGILVVAKLNYNAVYVLILAGIILLAQWYCFRLKKQDKLLKRSNTNGKPTN